MSNRNTAGYPQGQTGSYFQGRTASHQRQTGSYPLSQTGSHFQGRTASHHQRQTGSYPYGSHANYRSQEVTDETYPPAENSRTYPCGCPYPAPHVPGCMFHLYQQMINNHQMTKDLMTQYMNQTTKNPMELEMERLFNEFKQEMYRRFPHQESNKSSVEPVSAGAPSVAIPKLRNFGNNGLSEEKMSDCLKLLMTEGGVVGPKSQNRKLIEEQRNLKNLWVQFMNIFDMALDLADEASNARSMLNCHRKEEERLAFKRQMDQARRNCYKHTLTQTYQLEQANLQNNKKQGNDTRDEVKRKLSKTSSRVSSKQSIKSHQKQQVNKNKSNGQNNQNKDNSKEQTEDEGKIEEQLEDKGKIEEQLEDKGKISKTASQVSSKQSIKSDQQEQDNKNESNDENKNDDTEVDNDDKQAEDERKMAETTLDSPKQSTESDKTLVGESA